jgi:hypothetical protein
MAKKFLTPIKLVSLQSDPSNSQSGTFYFNSNLNKIRYFDGDSWGSLQKENLIEYPINTISPTVVDTWDLSLYTTIEYTLQIVQGTNFRSSKIMVLTDQNLVYYTEYGIISIGNDINGLSIDASTTTIPGGKLGKLVIQISDANTNNAQVKLLKTTIA